MENNTGDENFTWLQDHPVFDPAPLTKYEHAVGLAGFEMAVNDFIEEARFRVDTIGSAAQSGAVEVMLRETRILTSLCQSCGFLRLAELARVVEDVAGVRSARDILPIIGELFRNLELSLSELETFADDLGAKIRRRHTGSS